jgi:hypothetical protein
LEKATSHINNSKVGETMAFPQIDILKQRTQTGKMLDRYIRNVMAPGETKRIEKLTAFNTFG